MSQSEQAIARLEVGLYDRLTLDIQEKVAHLLFLPTYVVAWFWIVVVMRYRIPELERVRRDYRRIAAESGGPLLICANHLTLVDSIILLWAFGSFPLYFLNYRLFAWNIPEKRNFHKGLWRRLYTYLGKCVPVVRQGPIDETRRTMSKIVHLLSDGQAIMIFPEGTRSRSGRIDVENHTYGVGRLLQSAPGVQVVCAYLRGSSQKAYSEYPKRGDTFHLELALLQPATDQQGLRGTRDLSRQIVQKLADLENEYFKRLDAARSS